MTRLPKGFSDSERRLLLLTPRIGPAVVARLEEAGFDSLAKLRAVGADQAVMLISEQAGTVAWLNRRSALADVLSKRQD
jgi:hypothetical protein